MPWEHEPIKVSEAVSKIWIALPAPRTLEAAVAVSRTLAPETAAAALDVSVTVGGALTGRMVATGTLGSTDGPPAGGLAAPDSEIGVLHAAGVLNIDDAAHGVCPSGVDGMPGATWPESLVRQDAPTPEAGQGCDPSGRLICSPSDESGEQAPSPVGQGAAAAAWTAGATVTSWLAAMATAATKKARARSECTDTPDARAQRPR